MPADPAISAPSAAVPEPTRHYDLVCRDGDTNFFWRYRNEGVTLSADGLAWTIDGVGMSRRFADIYGIRLTFGSIPRSGSFGQCAIEFGNGDIVTISSVNRSGTPSDERAPVYRQFVLDLHQRLAPEDRRRIAFAAGNREGKQTFGWVMLVIAALFFLVLPIGLLLVTGELKTLFIAFAGVGLVYPFFKTLSANQPRTYNPGYIPDELFP